MATIEQVISNNLYIPTGLKKLLRISEEYYTNIQSISDTKVSINVSYAAGGATTNLGDTYNVTIPNKTGQSKIPFSSFHNSSCGMSIGMTTTK